MCASLFLALVLSGGTADEKPNRPEGNRVKLSVGELFIPARFEIPGTEPQLLVHLHGSAELMERHLVQSGWKAVLVTVTLNGLSSVYTKQFTDPQVFPKLVQESETALAKQLKQENVHFKRVTVSSFSAGFGGVRELLKSDDCYRRIDALIMADSIYAGYVGDVKERRVDRDLMTGFLRFARDAVDGKKTMVISHCQLQPDGYASTAETADYLLNNLGLKRESVDTNWAEGWKCTSRSEKGKLCVFGFEGTEGNDHMRHLRNFEKLMHVVPQ